MMGETSQYSRYMIRLARYCHCSAQLTCQRRWKILSIRTPHVIASRSLAKQSPVYWKNLFDQPLPSKGRLLRREKCPPRNDISLVKCLFDDILNRRVGDRNVVDGQVRQQSRRDAGDVFRLDLDILLFP